MSDKCIVNSDLQLINCHPGNIGRSHTGCSTVEAGVFLTALSVDPSLTGDKIDTFSHSGLGWVKQDQMSFACSLDKSTLCFLLCVVNLTNRTR